MNPSRPSTRARRTCIHSERGKRPFRNRESGRFRGSVVRKGIPESEFNDHESSLPPPFKSVAAGRPPRNLPLSCYPKKGLLTTASDERFASGPFSAAGSASAAPRVSGTLRSARASGVNNPAIQSATPLRQGPPGRRNHTEGPSSSPKGLLDRHERESARGFQALARRAKPVGGGL